MLLEREEHRTHSPGLHVLLERVCGCKGRSYAIAAEPYLLHKIITLPLTPLQDGSGLIRVPSKRSEFRTVSQLDANIRTVPQPSRTQGVVGRVLAQAAFGRESAANSTLPTVGFRDAH